MKPKYRAWDKRRKAFRDDVFIDINGNLYEFSKMTGYGTAISYLNNEYIELMQSTGLEDKNGIEIFEGDVVNISCHTPFYNVVEFDKKGASFMLRSVDKKWSNSYFTNYENVDKERFEITGNIYENPEFLEVE